MQNQRLPRAGYDNVAFETDGSRIVGTVLKTEDDGTLVVGNPYFDAVWQVPADLATVTDEPLNEPDA